MKKKIIIYPALIITIGCVTAILFRAYWIKSETAPSPRTSAAYPVSSVMQSNVYLYFIDPDTSFLMAEERVSVHADEPVRFAEFIIEALINGPTGTLMRALPEETKLRAAYVSQNGTAYVDFTEDISTYHPGGSRLEYLTIFSIVNSLIVNIPQIKAVKFLKGGQDALTLAGHIDIRSPFKANMLLVR